MPNSRTSADGTREQADNPPEKWFTTDDTPAIIDGDLWETAQRRLARNAADPTAPRQADGRRRGRATTTPSLEPGAFLLSGLLICGRCGGSMVGFCAPKRCRPGRVYVCGKYTHYATAECVRVQVREE